MVNLGCKDRLNNWTQAVVFVRREEELQKQNKQTKNQNRTKKSEVGSSEFSIEGTTCKSAQSVQITDRSSANLPEPEDLEVGVCFF